MFERNKTSRPFIIIRYSVLVLTVALESEAKHYFRFYYINSLAIMTGNEPPIEIDLPGIVKSRFSDNNQLSMYMHWAKMLQAKNWSEIMSRQNG